MCLSTVYVLGSDNKKELLCKNVASVLSEDGKLTFINLLGIPTTIRGEISNIDLVENLIYIKSKA